jgi:signal recognition particle subunit SEC65
MPELPGMTGAELKSAREFLGLSTQRLSEILNLRSDRRIMRMEKDQERVAKEVMDAVDEIYEETSALVRRLIDEYQPRVASGKDEVVLHVYRSDQEYRHSVKKPGYSAAWHRMVAARVADAVPGLVLDYREPPEVVNPRPWERDQQKPRKQPVPPVSSHATN